MLALLLEGLTEQPAYQHWLTQKGEDFIDEATEPVNLGVNPETNETQYIIRAAYDTTLQSWWMEELKPEDRIVFLTIYSRKVGELA